MAWNTNMDEAPKGETRELTLTHYRKKSAFTKTIRVKQPILLSVGGAETIKSYWSETRNQWVGLADGQEPDAWQPWPEPHKVEDK